MLVISILIFSQVAQAKIYVCPPQEKSNLQKLLDQTEKELEIKIKEKPEKSSFKKSDVLVGLGIALVFGIAVGGAHR